MECLMNKNRHTICVRLFNYFPVFCFVPVPYMFLKITKIRSLMKLASFDYASLLVRNCHLFMCMKSEKNYARLLRFLILHSFRTFFCLVQIHAWCLMTSLYTTFLALDLKHEFFLFYSRVSVQRIFILEFNITRCMYLLSKL